MSLFLAQSRLVGCSMNRPLRSALFVVFALVALPLPALADQEAKIDARIASWGRNCKNTIAARYPKAVMAEIMVELGATLQQEIDAGSITLKDIKRNGLSFNYVVQREGRREHVGYCNTDGEGNVTEVQQQR
jgi:uncharacterized protein YfaP (DUF2135 family)